MSKLKKLAEFLWWNGPGIIFKYRVSIRYIFNNPINKNSKVKLLLKILWWKVNKAYFKLPVIVKLAPKIKCICYPNSSHYSTFVLYTTFPEYGEMMMVKKILKEDDVFLDVGANIGIYSLVAASKITKGKIYAFEPSPASLSRLYENILLNNLTSVISVSKKVVSDKVGFHHFTINNTPDYNHISYLDEKSGTIKIPAVSLDYFINKKKLSRIKLIKIDVEGAELLVLKGLQKSLEDELVNILIVEIADWASKRFDITPEQVFDYLRRYGFVLYYFDANYQLRRFERSLETALNIIAFHKSKLDEILSELNYKT